ncbi:hypothetical protein GCM10018785_41980 [Streptomyces longispororuber]|uniref:Uncharacterized protein n=1 Tax=Streptomyces longispororuber TaxID=68230 RepID=A0A919DRA3_9ACTN|nr:hypothetical protein GCM10018785_41980 [Streptomyces longispororuber]
MDGDVHDVHARHGGATRASSILTGSTLAAVSTGAPREDVGLAVRVAGDDVGGRAVEDEAALVRERAGHAPGVGVDDGLVAAREAEQAQIGGRRR